MGAIAILLNARREEVIVDEGESVTDHITFLEDSCPGCPAVELDPADMASITLDVYELSTLAVVNRLAAVDILDANNGTIEGTTLKLKLDGDDNEIIVATAGGEEEWHVIRVVYTYIDGDGDTRTGLHQVRFKVRKLEQLPMVES
jgi:hypothetical protein